MEGKLNRLSSDGKGTRVADRVARRLAIDPSTI
jgi:hypothetical protein